MGSMERERAGVLDLIKLRGLADYQLGRGVGAALFPDEGVELVRSKSTGRIRTIYRDGALVATLRPKDGFLALTEDGARAILERFNPPPSRVVVRSDVGDFIRDGRSVFAKHVVDADSELRPGEEAIVLDERGGLLGVGRALMSAADMLSASRGVAVRIRRGVPRDRDGARQA
jgi:predicted RNA-binding protein (TIGR00451 family)